MKVIVIQVFFLIIILKLITINSLIRNIYSPIIDLKNHYSNTRYTRFKTTILRLKQEKVETHNENEFQLHSTSIKTENANIKRGKLYFATWSAIYFTCLTCIYYAVDHDIMQAEKYGIEPVEVMNKLCDWLEAHVINVTWITNAFRREPWMTKFTEAYLLTDLVPTTVIALAVYPFVLEYQKKFKSTVIDPSK